MKIRGGISKQEGATLAEFAIVAAGVFVPLMGLTMLMGKQIQTKHHYEQALRYAAWERTVYFAGQPRHPPPNVRVPVKSDAEIATEIQARSLANRNGLIKSNHRTGSVAEVMDPILYWQNRNNDRYENRLVKVQQTQNSEYLRNAATDEKITGPGASGLYGAINGLKGLTGFDVNTKGLYRSRVTMDLGDVNWLAEFKDSSGNPIDLRVDRSVQNNVGGKVRQLMLLSDGWNLGGRQSTMSQVKTLVPSNLLSNGAIKTVQRLASWLPFAKEYAPDWLELGKVDPDVVPPHRLGTFPR